MNPIKYKRKEKGLTQAQLADILGVTQANVSQWESGTAFPTSTKLPELARIFGCRIEELYGTQDRTA